MLQDLRVCRTPHPPNRSVLHIHTAVEECEVVKLVSEIDMKTKEAKKAKYVKSGAMCVCRIVLEKPLCMETFQVWATAWPRGPGNAEPGAMATHSPLAGLGISARSPLRALPVNTLSGSTTHGSLYTA